MLCFSIYVDVFLPLRSPIVCVSSSSWIMLRLLLLAWLCVCFAGNSLRTGFTGKMCEGKRKSSNKILYIRHIRYIRVIVKYYVCNTNSTNNITTSNNNSNNGNRKLDFSISIFFSSLTTSASTYNWNCSHIHIPRP